MRIQLNKYEGKYAERLFQMLRDKNAMKYTTCIDDYERCAEFLRLHENQRKKNGFAPWVLVSQSDGMVIGWGGISIDPVVPGWGAELVYFLSSENWGKGIGTEFAKFAVEFAQSNLEMQQLRAFVHAKNSASKRILEKVGFQYKRSVKKLNRCLYEIELSSYD